MRVLIVEDEPLLADAIGAGFRLEAIASDIVNDGEAALERLSINDYDVVVLDRDIPGVHGDDVCARVAADPDGPPVLMLTAAGSLRDRVGGLQLGADDYLTKPFEFEELVARVRTLARRRGRSLPPVLLAGDLRLDAHRREVYRGDRYVKLSRKEFAVLETLMQAQGGVLSAEQLLERAWDENADPFTNAVRITISVLRKKLGDPAAIVTVPGVGYRVAAEVASSTDAEVGGSEAAGAPGHGG
ncbi:response regulator transcription factor [Agreia sp. COWG]|uniref:response regulator transcription factor n=1 Tax=Agreia sp. COWG TaxID=2773266 RepID=UPI0019289C17|nr:response regulator transcription factor [Agreia sp. COWG]CAD6010013.1 Transcriptional regulatory protein CutR [Agreia sp. COWG]